MKKLSFLIAALFTASFAMAQNTAKIDQYGSNIGSVIQTGAGNDATIQQGSLGHNVDNSLDQPTGWKQGSYIQQLGDDNIATAIVRASRNGTSIYQEGDLNIAHQDVGSYDEVTTSYTKMGLDIDQLGNSNWATQKTLNSFGSYGIQGMTILQKGNFNVADQVSVGGMATTQTIRQIGNNNNNPTVSGNTFDLSSTTINNPLAVLVNPLTLPFKFNNGYGGTVSLPMTQYSNQMYGSAIMDVTGNDNNTYQFQEYRVWSTSGRNDAKLTLLGNRNDVAQGQLGENNNSEITLTGDDNVVSNSQYGDLNSAVITISGNSNVAGVEQTGNSNNAIVGQIGNGNIARIIQVNL